MLNASNADYWREIQEMGQKGLGSPISKDPLDRTRSPTALQSNEYGNETSAKVKSTSFILVTLLSVFSFRHFILAYQHKRTWILILHILYINIHISLQKVCITLYKLEICNINDTNKNIH